MDLNIIYVLFIITTMFVFIRLSSSLLESVISYQLSVIGIKNKHHQLCTQNKWNLTYYLKSKTKQNKTKQNKTKQNKTKQNRTEQTKILQNQ